MGDPELAARAQRAAVRLERSWDSWRRLNGLAAEQAQPISSYVGYSLAEPWGRPRVVFGLGAEEAERLCALLEQAGGEDPRFSQGLLWEPEPSHPAGAREQAANGSRPAEPGAVDSRPADRQPESARADTVGDWVPEPAGFQSAPPAVTSFQPAPTTADPAGPPDRGMPQGLGADLAGWTSSELPGQASAGLAAWPALAERPDH
jgi:hypothetical protein